MKITATSGGGFAGLTQRHAIDTRVSPAGPALEALLADIDFFDAVPAVRSRTSGADMISWTITVDADGRQHSITFTQDGSPASAAWEKLLARILAA